MINRKNVVQKAFRLDAKIVGHLETLADITGRQANEIVSFALKDLFVQNSLYFIESKLIILLLKNKNFNFNIAGLSFVFEDLILSIYTKNLKQKIANYDFIKIDVGEKILEKMLSLCDGEYNGYVLQNIVPVIEVTENEIRNICSSIMGDIDINFVEYQQWVNSYFDYD